MRREVSVKFHQPSRAMERKECPSVRDHGFFSSVVVGTAVSLCFRAMIAVLGYLKGTVLGNIPRQG